MNRKWTIGLLVLIMILCCLGLVVGGAAYYYYSSLTTGPAQAPVPVVQIFYPSNLADLPFGSVIPVGAEAFVPEGNQVTYLQLWADGEMVGDLSGSNVSLTASWGWVPSDDGEHTLVARAYNQDGGEGLGAIDVQVERSITDGDQDGVADGEDDCPDVVGAPEWNGCPPEAAGEIGAAWVPGGGNPPDEASEGIDEALGVDDPAAEEPPGEEGPIIAPEEAPPSEDPPVVVPEEDPPPPPPMALLEVEGLSLVSAIGARDVYCYQTLTSRPLERVPTDAEGNFVEFMAGDWNIGDFMGGALGRMVDVPEVGPLHFEMDCWGHFSDDPLNPDVRHMGIMSVDHGPTDWDGRELTAHGEMDANWFDIRYRICRGECETATLPTPYFLNLTNVGPNYELSWFWDGEPSVDNADVGFYVYRDGIQIATVPINNPFNVITLPPGDVEPPLCHQEYQFTVRAVRGADVQFSNPSNIAWAVSPAPCFGENRVNLRHTFPWRDAFLQVNLDHRYIRSHTDRVVVGAYPLIDGAPASALSFTWDGTSVGGGAGDTWTFITYRGSEPLTTNGLRLFMLTTADGVNPGGEVVYERDVPFDMTWQPGVPDLRIEHLFYPEGDDILRIAVSNYGYKLLATWEPTFAFFQDVGGVRTRVDALNSPPGLAPLTIMPADKKVAVWPGWTPAQFALLEPIFEVEVDPDNLVAEYDEGDNVYHATKPNIQVKIETIRVLAYGGNDAAGFPGCFTGLSGVIRGSPQEFLYFSGDGEKVTFPTFFDFPFRHELGLMLCPPQEFEVETELIPALKAGTCIAACTNYFGAHGQPIFAEGEHTPAWWPAIPGWGTDYCDACYTLAGQTRLNRDDNKLDLAYVGGDLEIQTTLGDIDIMADGSRSMNLVCGFVGVIPAADMAALPVMNRTLTAPDGSCEIVVSVESFP
jgi:hypothetical protein